MKGIDVIKGFFICIVLWPLHILCLDICLLHGKLLESFVLWHPARSDAIWPLSQHTCFPGEHRLLLSQNAYLCMTMFKTCFCL